MHGKLKKKLQRKRIVLTKPDLYLYANLCISFLDEVQKSAHRLRFGVNSRIFLNIRRGHNRGFTGFENFQWNSKITFKHLVRLCNTVCALI